MNISVAVAWDTETHLMSPGKVAPKIVVHSVCWDGKQAHLHKDLPDGLLQSKTIIGHNVAYDFACLAALHPELLPAIFEKYERGEVYDTMIAEWLLDNAQGLLREEYDEESGEYKTNREKYRLENLARVYLGWESYKDGWRLRYAELDGKPLEQWPVAAIEYPKKDALATYQIAMKQLKRNEELEGNALQDLPAQCRAYFWLHLSAAWGIELDPEHVRALRPAILAEVQAHEKELLAAGLLTQQKKRGILVCVGKKEPQRARVAKAYEKLGIEPPLSDGGKSGNKQIRTDRNTLRASGDPMLSKLADRDEKAKLLNTYVDHWIELGRGPINCSYGFAGTGRTTCYGPNLQQLPRVAGLRESFIARPGCVLSSTDYSTLELCTFAQVCLWIVGFSRLADALNENKDPHAMLGASLMGVEEEEMVALLKQKDATAKDYRQRAKAGNFGFPGGMGAPRFADNQRKQGTAITDSEAVALRNAWLEQWPEAREYFKRIGELTRGDSATIELFVSGMIRGGLGFTDCANTYFQGLAAAGAKKAGWLITKEMYTEGTALSGSRILAFVHDEFVCEHPEERAHEAATRVSEIMVQTMREYVPDVLIKAEPCLMRRWSKEAATVRDDNGRLIVWHS